MSEIRSIGLTSIKIGDIAEDGGMGQTLSPLGVTFQDTAELVRDDPEITEIYSEENDEPEEVVEVKGAARVRWKIMNIDPSEVVKVLGGSVSNGVYFSPVAKDPIEKSVEIITKTGLKIEIPRVKIYAKENFQFRKKGVLLIDIEARILTPTKAQTSPINWEQIT
ncbi:MAG: hypothetical protein BWX87_00651 [Bacteroidetes bacterium ADurb.Bin123]|mgnify:CR=1 FL=1|jgi:hypothetical protein|nr:MAG: hypothetical protein BWX87_00651 [Bacteroidetes bacterium ADurb.Bin123]